MDLSLGKSLTMTFRIMGRQAQMTATLGSMMVHIVEEMSYVMSGVVAMILIVVTRRHEVITTKPPSAKTMISAIFCTIGIWSW